MKKIIKLLLTVILLFFIFPMKAYCKPIVVVIDPGHGGEAQGGNMDDRIERDINLITANAMKDRLLMYDDIEVYLTRDNNDNPDMSRNERMKVARDHNADFFFSIHYNMSENHSLFGTECWTPMTGNIYSETMECATIINKDLAGLGLYNRGVKHRSSKRGNEYYGILSYSVEYNIPAIIIEHCHLDEERDSLFWNEDSYRQFGISDADAVAKYFELSSSLLGVDYTGYERETFDIPSSPVREDTTSPEACNIEIVDYDTAAGNATIKIVASDSNGKIQYYSYSVDNGVSYGRLESWNGDETGVDTITVPLKINEETALCVNVYNQYDLGTMSNIIKLPAADEPEEIIPEENIITIEQKITFEPKEKETDVVLLIALSVTLVIVILFSIIIVLKISEHKRRKRRRKRKK